MKLEEFKSEFSIIREEGLPLSAKTLAELLQATHAKGAPFRFRAKGFSMSPFIKDSDIITISALSNSSIVFGKPVAFIHPKTEKLIIHRAIGKSGDCYFIKGDRLTQTDGLIPEENILGVVTKIERDGEKIIFGLGLERFIITFLSKKGLLHLTFLGYKLIKRILGYCLMRVQSVIIYRRIARLLKYRINIEQETGIPHDANVTNFVAKKGESVIGFVQLLRDSDNGSLYAGYWLFGLTVRFLNRRMGIGEELTKNVIRKAREENANELSLLVYEDNHRAIRLYRKLGFERRIIPAIEEELEKERIKHGQRRVLMAKSLK